MYHLLPAQQSKRFDVEDCWRGLGPMYVALGPLETASTSGVVKGRLAWALLGLDQWCGESFLQLRAGFREGRR